MPLYEYKCDQCGETFEVIQRFSDPPVETCRSCGGPVHKVLSAPAIQFKGTGWYVTDYAKKGMTEAGRSNNGKSAPAPESSKTSADASSSSTSGSSESNSSGSSEKK